MTAEKNKEERRSLTPAPFDRLRAGLFPEGRGRKEPRQMAVI
jgi:hypothetical protein